MAPLLHSFVLGFEPCPGAEHTHKLPATELEREQFLPRELLKPLRQGFYPEAFNGMNKEVRRRFRFAPAPKTSAGSTAGMAPWPTSFLGEVWELY